MEQKLTDDNFLTYAMRHYDNAQCYNVEEFNDDLKRFVYLKKLFSRWQDNLELKEDLILNHLIILYNLFGDQATNMLFFKIDPQHWDFLATFLVFLGRMPDELPQYGIKLSDMELDSYIMCILREI